MKKDGRPFTECYSALFSLREYVSKIKDCDLGKVMLFVQSELKVDGLVQKLFELNDVLLKPQCNDCTLWKARAYFDTVLEVYLTFEARLHAHARIVHSSSFKSRAVMIKDVLEDLTGVVCTRRKARAYLTLCLRCTPLSMQDWILMHVWYTFPASDWGWLRYGVV